MLIIALLIAAWVRTDSFATAQTPSAAATEYNLKLARIYATAKFITWPDEAQSPNSPFVIGVVAPDPFQGGLSKLAGRKIKNRVIEVQIIQSVNDYRPCHILFIPAGASSEMARDVLALIANQPVLVFRDHADPNSAVGVACTFVRDGDKLLTETDPAELKRRQLSAEAQLLSLNIIRLVKPITP